MEIGENIKRIRKEQGLTQKKLGELCGIAESNIRKYENGKQNPKIETVDKIAHALKVNIVDIMDDYTFEQYQTTSEYQEGLKELSAEQGIVTILSSIYDSVEEKKIELRPGVYTIYYKVVDKENSFILRHWAIMKLLDYTQLNLPLLVELLAENKTENELIAEAMQNFIN